MAARSPGEGETGERGQRALAREDPERERPDERFRREPASWPIPAADKCMHHTLFNSPRPLSIRRVILNFRRVRALVRG
jgi:hypothetical protein